MIFTSILGVIGIGICIYLFGTVMSGHPNRNDALLSNNCFPRQTTPPPSREPIPKMKMDVVIQVKKGTDFPVSHRFQDGWILRCCKGERENRVQRERCQPSLE